LLSCEGHTNQSIPQWKAEAVHPQKVSTSTCSWFGHKGDGMFSKSAKPWQKNGARVATQAYSPERFIDEHVSPLFFRRTYADPSLRDCKTITSEKQFWREAGALILGTVKLVDFKLTDWFPRAPGVYWSKYAQKARDMTRSKPYKIDPDLGEYFSPESKMSLIEGGGIGTIRLRPRKIDGEDCWLATALTETECHGGIPLAIPNTALRKAGVSWGDRVSLEGRVRFLQDAGLDDIADRVHHARPLIVFVDELQGVVTRRSHEPVIITPVALFEGKDSHTYDDYHETQYTFVHCAAGHDSELDAAADWIEKYATLHGGRVITNFDEQRPVLADAPLSYQRLVARTYDRSVLNRIAGTAQADRIDRLVQTSITNQYFGDVHMSHTFNVGGSAIINIDSTLNNVTQTIGDSPGLDPAQKSQLETMVMSLKAELVKLKDSHADETKEIADALEKAVATAAKPPQERKKNLLQLSAKGLKEAAELVKDTAPSILTAADQIAKFIAGL
jgi:hypothetical protein